jgi:hypothetical protein
VSDALSAGRLRLEISARNHARGLHNSHEVSWGPSASIIFAEADGQHGNFLQASIDMRLGPLLVEAKLTEASFQIASIRLLSRYRDVNDVFDKEQLPIRDGGLNSWQTIRGVLAA